MLSGALNPNFGKSLKDETKEKIRQKLLNRTVPKDVKEKISKTLESRVKSQETCRNISISKRNKNGKKVIIENIYTNEKLYFDTLAEAARQLKISEGGLKSSVKIKNTMRNGIVCKFC